MVPHQIPLFTHHVAHTDQEGLHMVKKPPTLTYDPARLLTLAKGRDTKRAVARALASKYQDEREKLADARRRAALARENALHDHGAGRAVGEEAAARLETEAEGIRARMAESQGEIDVTNAEAAEAGRLVAACLKFAKAEGLSIPCDLRDEAEPRAMMGVA